MPTLWGIFGNSRGYLKLRFSVSKSARTDYLKIIFPFHPIMQNAVQRYKNIFINARTKSK